METQQGRIELVTLVGDTDPSIQARAHHFTLKSPGKHFPCSHHEAPSRVVSCDLKACPKLGDHYNFGVDSEPFVHPPPRRLLERTRATGHCNGRLVEDPTFDYVMPAGNAPTTGTGATTADLPAWPWAEAGGCGPQSSRLTAASARSSDRVIRWRISSRSMPSVLFLPSQ